MAETNFRIKGKIITLSIFETNFKIKGKIITLSILAD